MLGRLLALLLAAVLLSASNAVLADEAAWVRFLDAGTAAYNRRDPAEATRQFEFALKEAEGFGESDTRLATSLAWLAELYRVQRRFDEAERLIRRTILIDEKYRGLAHTDLAMSLESLALLFHTQNRQREMEPVLTRALSIYESALGPSHARVASSLNNLASLYRSLGRLDEAEPLVSRALAIREKVLGLDHPDTLQSRSYLAQLHRDLARNRPTRPRPEPRRAEAAPAREAVTPEAVAPVPVQAAPAAVQAAPAPVAQPLPVESVAPPLQVALPPLETAAKPAPAVRAQPVPEKPAVPAAVLAPPVALATKPPVAAPRVAQPVTPLVSPPMAPQIKPQLAPQAAIQPSPVAPAPPARPPYRTSLALQMVTLGASAARNSASVASQAFEVMQLAREREDGGAVARIVARFGRDDRALARLVAGREDLLDHWHGIDKSILEAFARSATAEERRLRAELAAIDQRLAQQDALIEQSLPAYRQHISPQPVPLSTAQSLLGADEALLSFLVGESSSYLMVVRHDRFMFLNLDIGRDELTSIVKRLRAQLDHPSGDEAARSVLRTFPVAQANQLYRRILADAAPALQGAAHLLIVADDTLNGLPFAALVTEPLLAPIAAPEDHAKVSWLGRRYALTMLPSEGTLRSLRRTGLSAPGAKPFVGYGDPLLGGEERGGRSSGAASRSYARDSLANVNQIWSFAPLPETRYALYAMADILHADQGEVHLQGEATESNVKGQDLAGYRVIAFATHGFMADEFKGLAEAALVFSPPPRATERDDGLLTASEVAQLRLAAELVILTATSTAAADGTPDAGGVSGLARAFLHAGGHAVLATHWAVPSDATLKLVTRTLRERNRGVGNAEALRRAMLPLMNGEDRLAFAHPGYWAPFMVIGEGNRRIAGATPQTADRQPVQAQPATQGGEGNQGESQGGGFGRLLQGIFGGGK